MKVIAFIIHGQIRQRNKFIASAHQVFAPPYRFLFFITEYKHHSMELAYRAVEQGAEYVISVGGDGSLNEVVNGVMKAREITSLPRTNIVKIGALPHGTGNDFARTVGVTNDLLHLKKLIDDDGFQPIDIGLATYKDVKGVDITRYFINVTDVGLGGHIVKDLDSSWKIFGAAITYQKSIISGLLTYRNQPVTMKADDYLYAGKIKELVVANGKYFAGGLDIAPDASITDGLFSILVAGEISLLAYLQNFPKMRRHKKIIHPEVQYLTASEVLIESPVLLPIDMDGEFVGYAPLKLTVAPKAVHFLY